MELVLPMYNAHPYFSLKNLGKIVRIMHGKVQQIVLFYLIFEKGKNTFHWFMRMYVWQFAKAAQAVPVRGQLKPGSLPPRFTLPSPFYAPEHWAQRGQGTGPGSRSGSNSAASSQRAEQAASPPVRLSL